MTAKWNAIATPEAIEIQLILSGGEFGYNYTLSMFHDNAYLHKPMVKTVGIPEKGLPMETSRVDAENLRQQFSALLNAIKNQSSESFICHNLSGSYVFQGFRDGEYILHEMLYLNGKMMLQTIQVSIQSLESLSYYFDSSCRR